MKLAMLLGGLTVLLFIGGLTFLATSDAPVKKTEITKTIPNERFFDAN